MDKFTAKQIAFLHIYFSHQAKHICMVIIAYKTLREFSERYPDAEIALEEWFDKTRRADWNSITDVRNTFRYADYIGNERVVFNIRGNVYRLVAAISYKHRTVYIKFIGTHQEYDKIDVTTINSQ